MKNSISFETLPSKLQMQILSWLPLKSLVKCLCVSKKWASIIRSKEFRAVYMAQSMTRPRVLFLVKRTASLPPEPEMLWYHSEKQTVIRGPHDTEELFNSVYQEEEPFLSSGQQQMRIPLDTTFDMSISQPIRGLICLQLGTKFAICNPGTKKIRTLPEIQVPENSFITSYFGYDEDAQVFKVLCVTMLWDTEPSKSAYDYQVLTLGSDEELSSWRQITCTIDHTPETQGLCKGGVLYYGAMSTGHEPLVMRFHVMSEEFTVIESPHRHFSKDWKFVIYNEEIAVVNDSDFLDGYVNQTNGSKAFYIWLLNESTRKWRNTRICIRRWEQNVGNVRFVFRGTGSNKLVFAQVNNYYEDDFSVLYYDTVKENLRRIQIEGLGDSKFNVRTILDHVDSTWLM